MSGEINIVPGKVFAPDEKVQNTKLNQIVGNATMRIAAEAVTATELGAGAVTEAKLAADVARSLARTFATVGDMEAWTPPAGLVAQGLVARALGYYAAGDGGGGDFRIVEDATLVANGGTIVDLGGSLRGVRKLEGEQAANALWFGMQRKSRDEPVSTEEAATNTAALQAAINYALGENQISGVFIPAGHYGLAKTPGETYALVVNSDLAVPSANRTFKLFGDSLDTILFPVEPMSEVLLFTGVWTSRFLGRNNTALIEGIGINCILSGAVVPTNIIDWRSNGGGSIRKCRLFGAKQNIIVHGRTVANDQNWGGLEVIDCSLYDFGECAYRARPDNRINILLFLRTAMDNPFQTGITGWVNRGTGILIERMWGPISIEWCVLQGLRQGISLGRSTIDNNQLRGPVVIRNNYMEYCTEAFVRTISPMRSHPLNLLVEANMFQASNSYSATSGPASLTMAGTSISAINVEWLWVSGTVWRPVGSGSEDYWMRNRSGAYGEPESWEILRTSDDEQLYMSTGGSFAVPGSGTWATTGGTGSAPTVDFSIQPPSDSAVAIVRLEGTDATFVRNNFNITSVSPNDVVKIHRANGSTANVENDEVEFEEEAVIKPAPMGPPALEVTGNARIELQNPGELEQVGKIITYQYDLRIDSWPELNSHLFLKGNSASNPNAGFNFSFNTPGFFRVWFRQAGTSTTHMIGRITVDDLVGDGWHTWVIQIDATSDITVRCWIDGNEREFEVTTEPTGTFDDSTNTYACLLNRQTGEDLPLTGVTLRSWRMWNFGIPRTTTDGVLGIIERIHAGRWVIDSERTTGADSLLRDLAFLGVGRFFPDRSAHLSDGYGQVFQAMWYPAQQDGYIIARDVDYESSGEMLLQDPNILPANAVVTAVLVGARVIPVLTASQDTSKRLFRVLDTAGDFVVQRSDGPNHDDLIEPVTGLSANVVIKILYTLVE